MSFSRIFIIKTASLGEKKCLIHIESSFNLGKYKMAGGTRYLSAVTERPDPPRNPRPLLIARRAIYGGGGEECGRAEGRAGGALYHQVGLIYAQSEIFPDRGTGSTALSLQLPRPPGKNESNYTPTN